MKIKILLIIIFLLQNISIYGNPDIQLTDINIYNELKSKISANTNLPNKNYEIFQDISFKLKSNITKDLAAWVLFKSEYVQFHWKKDNRFLYINAAAIEYNINPVSKLIFGSMYIDYSPYIIKSYPWVIDLFRGIGFEYKNYKLYIHSFIANNGDNPDESTWDTPVTFDLDYSKIDKGYTSADKHSEYPSLWFGTKAVYKFDRNEYFTPSIGLIYLRENYTKKDFPAGYVDIYDNNIFGTELNFTLFDYITVKNTGAVTLDKTDKYTAVSNYYGENKPRLEYSKMEYNKYTAGKIRFEINDLFMGIFNQFNTRAYYEYEKVDALYHPNYMEQNLDNRTINPYENVYSGREGYWAGIEQHLGFNFYFGVGYQYYVYRASYYHNFPDGSIFTEKQIFLKNEIYKPLRLFIIYQMRDMLRGTLPDGNKKMNSFYIRLQSDIINNVYMELEYNKNKNYYENYDEMLIKFMVWGW